MKERVSECADTIRMQHFVVLNVAVKMKKLRGCWGGGGCLILEFECGCKDEETMCVCGGGGADV